MSSSTDKNQIEDNLVQADAKPWQTALIDQLVSMKRQGKLAHAILVDVSTSVDSRSFGWQLVSSLLCIDEDQTNAPCGQCQHCLLMKANSYPDFSFTTLIENDRTHKLNRDIKIDQIRKLIHRLSLTANLQAGKLALIYPAERMNPSAANSLLKTLEEPAAESTIVLLTHNSGRLPVTIRSRCQQWRVDKPSKSVARKWLDENGLDDAEAAEYLDIAREDAELALQLKQQDVMPQMHQFRLQLKDYLNGKISVPSLSGSVRQIPENVLCLMIENVLLSLLHKQLEKSLDQDRKMRLRALLDLLRHSQTVLQSKENNLLLQLQLEDVLISMKQIMNPRRSHASSTRQPGHIVTQHQG